MRKTNWKDFAELIGIASIVASLIFVGLQMQQAEDIALAELNASSISDNVDLASLINEHPGEFPYDQRALLSQPELESLVETKRVNSEVMVFKVAELIVLQQEILDLIDQKLANR